MTPHDRTETMPLFREDDSLLATGAKTLVLLAMMTVFVLVVLIGVGILLTMLVDVWAGIW